MNVLIPVNDSDLAQVQTDFVINHDWPQNTKVLVLYVMEPMSQSPFAKSHSPQLIEEMKREHQNFARKLVSDCIDRLRQSKNVNVNAIEVKEQIIDGFAKREVIKIAKRWPANMIVAGAHAHGAASTMEDYFLGSVSAAIVWHAPCSFMLVRKS